MNETQHPLILVFYLDAELMMNKEIMIPFTDYVNSMIEAKEANIMAFFLPTTGEERVECINPIIVSEPDMVKINSMIDEIKEKFSVGTENCIDNNEEIDCCGDNCDCDCNCEDMNNCNNACDNNERND
jgi:hypothetical protein